MKFVTLTAIALLTASPALAAPKKEEPFDFMRANPRFAQIYMGCDSDKASECEKKVSSKYCKGFDKLPTAVKSKLTKEMACDFLAGEITGNNAEQDMGNAESLRDLNCLGSAGETLEMLRREYGKGETMRALLFFNTEFIEAMDACDKPAGKKGS